MADTPRAYDQLFPSVPLDGRAVQVGPRFFRWKASTRRWAPLPIDGTAVSSINQLGDLAAAFHTFIHVTLPAGENSDG